MSELRQRQPREKDARHLNFIRSLPCCICGDDIGTEAAHIRTECLASGKRETGGAEKPSDKWALPLCNRHHTEQHTMNEMEFWKKYGIDPFMRALTLREQSRPIQRKSEAALRERVLELEQLINTPQTSDWVTAVQLEAAHQIVRWGVNHDAGKSPSDWFWLIGYLSGKALSSAILGNKEKAKHHTISTGAALLNWHRHLTGESTLMRPGIAEPVALPATQPGGSK